MWMDLAYSSGGFSCRPGQPVNDELLAPRPHRHTALELPGEVNRHMRALADSVTARPGSGGSAHNAAATSAAARWPDLTAPSRNPVHSSAVSVPAQ
jgi:hypothetical protein